MPVLALGGERNYRPVIIWANKRLAAGTDGGALTAAGVWRRWANDVSELTVPCGHLIPEHASAAVIQAVLPYFAAAESRGKQCKHPGLSRETGE